MIKRCAECGSTALLSVESDERVQIGPRTFTKAVAAKRCELCGETYTAFDELSGFELQVAGELVRECDGTREAFRYIRKALGLPAIELARLLDVNAATLSRWETGEREVPFLARCVLAALVMDRLGGRSNVMEYLERARQPSRRLPRVVRIGR